MKQVLIVTIGLIVVSCGNYSSHRSGKLRKVRIRKNDKKEAIVFDVVKPNDEREYNYEPALEEMSEVSVSESEVEAIVAPAESDMFLELEVQKQNPETIKDVTEWSGVEESEEGKSVVIKKHPTDKVLKIRCGERKKKRRKAFRIDWAQVWDYTVVVLIVSAIVVGLILEPVVTLVILIVALILLLFGLVAAILGLFFEIFDIFF